MEAARTFSVTGKPSHHVDCLLCKNHLIMSNCQLVKPYGSGFKRFRWFLHNKQSTRWLGFTFSDDIEGSSGFPNTSSISNHRLFVVICLGVSGIASPKALLSWNLQNSDFWPIYNLNSRYTIPRINKPSVAAFSLHHDISNDTKNCDLIPFKYNEKLLTKTST